MTMKPLRSLYYDGITYDQTFGEFADGADLDYYRRRLERYPGQALELACGSGRLTIPLAESGFDIAGLDLSEAMLGLAKRKAERRGLNITLVFGDVRDFALEERFSTIFFPANSLSHLTTAADLAACLKCVRKHLLPGGRFLFDIFNPSLSLLSRDPEGAYPVGEHVDDTTGDTVSVTETSRYDAATQINHIEWGYRWRESGREETLSFEMRQFFPQEMDALLACNGFNVEYKYGDFDESPFVGASRKQIYVCSLY